MFYTIIVTATLLSTGLPEVIGWDKSLSTYMKVRKDHVLAGFVIKTQWMLDLLSCAQKCLTYQDCFSVNYEANYNLKMGLCEFNNYSAKTKDKLTYKDGSLYVEYFQNEVMRFTFTTLKAKGRDGPKETSGYTNTTLEGAVKLNKGIQCWTVPYTGTYTIEALGASGKNGTSQNSSVWRLGGLGAKIKGTFYFEKGTQLKILVGQQGTRVSTTVHRPGSGGGGSFVTLIDNTPLLIAGGGGGGSTASHDEFTDGDPGQATRNGSHHGGSNGSGGKVFDTGGSSSPLCSAGAGLLTAGEKSALGESPSSFVDGGRGGHFVVSGDGGFGGGGYSQLQGGGGGGYSGGGVTGNGISGTAGGGGSFNAGLRQTNKAGVNKGDGRVVITLLEKEI